MAADRSQVGGTGREGEDRASSSDDVARNRARRRVSWAEPEGVNSIRLRRARRRTGEEPRAGAPSAAKKERDLKSVASQAPAASAAKPPGAAVTGTEDLWALPQSVGDRFVQDKGRFYFPDGAPAFRDRGTRLTTGSENTEVIRSLVEIAGTRGWEEVTVDGTKRFRQEAWRQGRLAGLAVRGYKPTAPERAAVVRALARQAGGAQMELGVSEDGLEKNAATGESLASPADARTSNARGARHLIVGKLIDHGRESYQFDPHESMSYFIEIGTAEGKRTIWGKDLERAMKQSLTQPQIGEEIGIRSTGADRVTVKRQARDADGRIVTQREIDTRRNHWVVERREFFEARAAAAELVRDANIDRRDAERQHPELRGTYQQLRAAQLVARRIRDPEDRETFVALVRGALADSIARGDPLKPVRLRERAARVPERRPPEREPDPART